MVWLLFTRRVPRMEKGRSSRLEAGVGRSRPFRDRRAWSHVSSGIRVGAALFGAVLANDFHLENLVGLLVGLDFGVGLQGDDPVLKGVEPTLDLAFGLGRRGDEMGDAQAAQGSLELAFRVALIDAGACAEEAQGVGVDGFGQAVGFEGAAEMLEVIPCGFSGNG